MEPKPDWLEKAKQTFAFHRSKCRAETRWSIPKTAKALRRSIGSISEDLLIARWSLTHEKQLEKFNYAYEALKFIRNKKKELELGEY